MKSEGHSHKCKECGVDYRHYMQDDKCKEPETTTCGVCCKTLGIDLKDKAKK